MQAVSPIFQDAAGDVTNVAANVENNLLADMRWMANTCTCRPVKIYSQLYMRIEILLQNLIRSTMVPVFILSARMVELDLGSRLTCVWMIQTQQS